MADNSDQARGSRESTADPSMESKLIGQRQGFWLRPEGRWINPAMAPS